MNQKNYEYIPGQCNLGRKEILKRKIQTLAGILISLIFAYYIHVNNLNSYLKLLLVIPVSYAVLCYFQAKEKFCVMFGAYGVYNLTDERNPVAVEDDEYKIADRKKAIRVLIKSILIALILTLIYFYISR